MLCLHSDFHPRNTTFLRSVFLSPAVTRHAPVPVRAAAASARCGPQAPCTADLCVFLSAAMSLLGSRNMVQALLLSLSPSHSFTLLSLRVTRGVTKPVSLISHGDLTEYVLGTGQ